MNTNDFIRIPFMDHGRTREGVDCWGLACVIFKEVRDISLPLMSVGYENTKDKLRISDLIETNATQWTVVEEGDEQLFDMAVFRMRGRPMHIGVVVKPGLMIHCERGSGVHLTRYYKEGQWDRRLEGFYRYAANSSFASSVPST